MKRFALLSALLFSLSTLVFAAVKPYKKSTLVTVPAEFTVAASVDKTWRLLSSVDGFCALTGFKPAAGATGSFARPGDAVPAPIWSDAGILMATMVKAMESTRPLWMVCQVSPWSPLRITW